MKWTEATKPNTTCSYDHVKCQSPIGEFLITWKSWKDSPSYDIDLQDKWIGSSYSLEDAKAFCEAYLKNIAIELNKFIE